MMAQFRFKKHPEEGYRIMYTGALSRDPKEIGQIFKVGKAWCVVGMGGERFRTRQAAARAALTYTNAPIADAMDEETWRRHWHNRSRSDRRLSVETANAVWDILLEECGAPGSDREREWFVHSHTKEVEQDSYRSHEYRFMGVLGFGGKFWNEHNRFRVSAYKEDTDGETILMMARANKRLQDLYEETFNQAGPA